jgi:hypothetical protein
MEDESNSIKLINKAKSDRKTNKLKTANKHGRNFVIKNAKYLLSIIKNIGIGLS